jgi:hypothetical protein
LRYASSFPQTSLWWYFDGNWNILELVDARALRIHSLRCRSRCLTSDHRTRYQRVKASSRVQSILWQLKHIWVEANNRTRFGNNKKW